MKTNFKLVFYSTFLVWMFFAACGERNTPRSGGDGQEAGPGSIDPDESVSRDDYGRDGNQTNSTESDSEYQQRMSSKELEQGNTTGDNGKQKKGDE